MFFRWSPSRVQVVDSGVVAYFGCLVFVVRFGQFVGGIVLGFHYNAGIVGRRCWLFITFARWVCNSVDWWKAYARFLVYVDDESSPGASCWLVESGDGCKLGFLGSGAND
mmetsp:Transcript_524/g.663  ORF Transcript_524/g.663 Transcript_524/m.663 type:complete len:110 (+) Transcript_524:3010-3339(+)